MAKKGMPLPPLPQSHRSLPLAAKQYKQSKLTSLLPPLPAKSRTIAVRLISMAMTGYYKTLVRPRQHHPLSMLKYDPVGAFAFFSLSSFLACERELKDCFPPSPPQGRRVEEGGRGGGKGREEQMVVISVEGCGLHGPKELREKKKKR